MRAGSSADAATSAAGYDTPTRCPSGHGTSRTERRPPRCCCRIAMPTGDGDTDGEALLPRSLAWM
eukprot:10780633-Alexandrium_andersonii.AAC.1